MTLLKLDLKPGINRDSTSYSNTGSWYDCDRIRFKNGRPQSIGGWQRYTTEAFDGKARSLFRFAANDGLVYTGIGTTCKFYMENGGLLDDVTPIRATLSAAVNPLSTVSGSDLVTVLDTAHLAVAGDIIIMSGASAIGGVPAGDLNKEHSVYDVVDGDNYRIRVATTATSTVNGAGGTVTVQYLFYCGTDETILSAGWGSGTWGSGTWGISTVANIVTSSTRIWYVDNFGEDLVINPRNGPLFYWDATTPTARAIYFSALAGASNTPTVATCSLVSQNSRHVVAFGCNPLGSSVQSNLLVRWSDQEDAADWTPSTTNQAGDYTLNRGSRIVKAVQAKSDILIFTDKSLYTMQYIGGQLVFGFNAIADNVYLAGAQSAIVAGDTVYWMSSGGFHIYNGRVSTLPCPISSYIRDNVDWTRGDKIYAASHSDENEVLWFYQSVGSAGDVDRYVVYNYAENLWYFGSLVRTSWVEDINSAYPIAASTDGYLYQHEIGDADHSTGSPVDIGSFIESADIELGDGDSFMFVDRFIPDIDFGNSSSGAPAVNVILKARNFPGGSEFGSTTNEVARLTVTPSTHTTYKNVRLRGRSMAMRISSGAAGTAWGLGSVRIEARPDGRK